MNPTLGLAMMTLGLASLAFVALQGRLVRRTSDPEGREELRQMEARMLARRRREGDGE